MLSASFGETNPLKPTQHRSPLLALMIERSELRKEMAADSRQAIMSAPTPRKKLQQWTIVRLCARAGCSRGSARSPRGRVAACWSLRTTSAIAPASSSPEGVRPVESASEMRFRTSPEAGGGDVRRLLAVRQHAPVGSGSRDAPTCAASGTRRSAPSLDEVRPRASSPSGSTARDGDRGCQDQTPTARRIEHGKVSALSGVRGRAWPSSDRRTGRRTS